MKYNWGVICLLICGCTNAKEPRITEANVVIKDDMPQLKVCFDRKLLLDEKFITYTKVSTKNGFTFGRSDMYLTGSRNAKENCIFEPPYFFLRNSRDENMRKIFMENMKPNNILSIEIKLGITSVNLNYSEKYKISEYKKVF